MGISPYALQMLIQHRNANLFEQDQKVLQLGKQKVGNKIKCNEILIEQGLTPLSLEPDLFGDIELFQSLGFKEVFSLDVSNFENADYLVDLNLELDTAIPRDFDLVFDGGTAEHVFDFKQLLMNIHKLLNIGGTVVHASPSNNHVDHGFYQFSPTVFYDWYYANNWEILDCFFFEYQRDADNIPWRWFNYEPGSLDPISFGGLNDSLWGTWFVAKKTKSATSDVIPQQGFYQRQREWN